MSFYDGYAFNGYHNYQNGVGSQGLGHTFQYSSTYPRYDERPGPVMCVQFPTHVQCFVTPQNSNGGYEYRSQQEYLDWAHSRGGGHKQTGNNNY